MMLREERSRSPELKFLIRFSSSSISLSFSIPMRAFPDLKTDSQPYRFLSAQGMKKSNPFGLLPNIKGQDRLTGSDLLFSHSKYITNGNSHSLSFTLIFCVFCKHFMNESHVATPQNYTRGPEIHPRYPDIYIQKAKLLVFIHNCIKCCISAGFDAKKVWVFAKKRCRFDIYMILLKTRVFSNNWSYQLKKVYIHSV